VTNWTAANPLRNHVTSNELEIGFVTLGNMRANGVQTLAAWCFGLGCDHHHVREPFYLEPYPVSELCHIMVGP
jgi:hypothetical protein